MDIRHIAQEYYKLIGKQYIIGIGNGEEIRLSFKREDFYHLIGFPKFKDASIVRMIEDSAYNKRQFFQDVLNGKISFDETKISIKNMEKYYVDGKWKELNEVEIDRNVSLVLNNRMSYFSYDNMDLLIKGDLIALFDKNKAEDWRKIDAEKIFFRLLENEKKNLNFFIRKENSGNRNCPISFFLEENKNEYLYNRNGKLIQQKVQVTYRSINNNGTELQDFTIFWNNVRFGYSKDKLSELYKAQKRLQEFFPNKTVIDSKKVENYINNNEKKLDKIISELNRLEETFKYKLMVQKYNNCVVADEKENYAIQIVMEYNIDIEKENISINEEEVQELEKEIKKHKQEITILKKRLKKCRKFMPDIKKMEMKEIVYIYSNFIPQIKKYEQEFITFLIYNKKIREEIILPREVHKIYVEWKKLRSLRT